MNSLRVICASLVLSFSVSAAIPRFQEVVTGIYRGGQAENATDYDKLAKLGVKTVINLRTTDKDIAKEKKELARRGIKLVSIQILAVGYPQERDVEGALSILTNPVNQPVFVHCKEGKDRTGLIFGLYRVRYQNWSKQDAYDEMLKIGFNPLYAGLASYFWKEAY